MGADAEFREIVIRSFGQSGALVCRKRWLGALAASCLALAGCQRDPMEKTISAATPTAFATWQSRIASDSNSEFRQRVTEAVQEIRLSVAAEREVKRVLGEPITPGNEEIDAGVRKTIDGRPLREIVQRGYELRVRRLRQELVALEQAMAQNAQLVTRPGDVASKQHLEGLRDRQAVRVAKYKEDLAAAERELEPLAKASGRMLLAPDSDVIDIKTVETEPERVPSVGKK
jgi:hypothetical protein